MPIELSFSPNRLYYGDCLDVLKGWPAECVDLVYLDPPQLEGELPVEHGQDPAHRERLDPEHEPRGGEDNDAVKLRWKQGRRLRGGGCVMTHDGCHFFS